MAGPLVCKKGAKMVFEAREAAIKAYNIVIYWKP